MSNQDLIEENTALRARLAEGEQIVREGIAELDRLAKVWADSTNTINRYAIEINTLRPQLAAAYEAIGSALALLRQDQRDAAMLVLDDALKGKAR